MDVSTVWDFCGELVGSIRPRKGYVPATVTRIDNDGTVWVTTGDGMEAPASTRAAGVAVGDVVSVSWSGAQMGVVGNASDPAAGIRAVGAVRKAAESASKVASGARAIADAIGQHFFTDDNGVHVSTEKGNPTGERNILMNSLGILLRHGSSWLASFSDSAVAFYDGLGNAAANIVAQFGADGAVIGYASGNHAALGSESFDIYHDDVEMVHFGYGEGASASGTAEAPYYTLGVRSTAGAQTKGNYSVAAGYIVEASGFASHAEGDVTIANAPRSHAEGSSTIASGNCSHAEGATTYAAGFAAHAEGYSCQARGDHSHAQNLGTIAGTDQTAIGKYNANDPNNAFEVGNGTADDARSNAFAVGWNGDLTYQGTLHGATWQTGTSGTTTGGSTALPAEGTYILVTAHNSTPALNGIWIVRTGGNTAFRLAGGGNVTVTVSGTTLTVTTTAGTVNVYYQLCGT